MLVQKMDEEDGVSLSNTNDMKETIQQVTSHDMQRRCWIRLVKAKL